MRYLVGIDLGTTNTVVYYLDTEQEEPQVALFEIPQLTEVGEVSEKASLPSFLYLPDAGDVPDGSLALPWDDSLDYSVGALAQKNSSSLPLKVISSTKSWLCAEHIDREGAVLPWNRNKPENQISPVEASTRIIQHVKNAWNHQMAADSDECRLENQSVILTVPASFDAVARELTVKAANQAGLSVTLLEEPLSAFYSWLDENSENWRDDVQPNDVILVCDIGGGTSDFSLIKVVDNEGNLEFERLAVGNHILLGGDNMDLTMAYVVAGKLQQEQNVQLDSYQITGLTHACRQAKEVLLADEGAPVQTLTVLGRGSSVIGGTITAELSRQDIEQVLLEGFFPICQIDDKPDAGTRSGFRDVGLNYESNPAITKHLAAFLSKHCNGPEEFPNCILFNGGVTKSPVLQERIVHVLQHWIPEGKDVNLLCGTDPDLAVARGGACYANVRRSDGIRVKAGSSHSYYVGVESAMPAIPGFTPPVQALCVVPFGLEEGSGCDVPYQGLGLTVGETTEFKFFAANSRSDDEPGTIIPDAGRSDELSALPVLSATLPATDDVSPGSLLPVKLRAELTEIGTLQIWCLGASEDEKWKLEFDLRNSDNSGEQ